MPTRMFSQDRSKCRSGSYPNRCTALQLYHRAIGHRRKERTATSGRLLYWLCSWRQFGGFQSPPSLRARRRYKHSISIDDHAFLDAFQTQAGEAALRSFRSRTWVGRFSLQVQGLTTYFYFRKSAKYSFSVCQGHKIIFEP